jgi:hypothetical protein
MDRRFSPFLLLIVLVTACDIGRFGGGDRGPNTPATKPSSTFETKASPTVTQKPAPKKASLADVLRRAEGKYPYEIKLLENVELKTRLKKLLGAEFDDLRDNFNVESPAKVANDIFMASACQAHNCGANNYVIFVDLGKDNINVYHIEESGTQHYFENGEIDLPVSFARELDEIR